MQYVSPFTQMGISIDELKAEPHLLNYNVFKKRVLAEFELHKRVALTLPSGELSKNDVLLFFESIQKDFQHHTRIVNDLPLLKFLENNHLTESFVNSYSDEAFLSFLEPYFVHSYCTIGIELLNNQDLSAKVFSSVPLLIPAEFNPDLFEPLRARINSFTGEIEEIASMIKEADGIKPAGIYFQIYGENAIEVLNALDNKIFGIEKDNFLKAALQLVSACKKEIEAGYRNEELVEFVLSKIEKLKAERSYKAKIKKFAAQKVIKPEPSKKEKSALGSGFYIILGILLVIPFFAFKIVIYLIRTLLLNRSRCL